MTITKEVAIVIIHARMLGLSIQKIGEIWGGKLEWDVGSKVLTMAEKALGLPVAYVDSDQLSLELESLYEKIGDPSDLITTKIFS